MKIYQIIKKNFLVLLRSRSSALIILLGPLLVMFLVGIAFSNASEYNIKIGYYSSSYSELSDSFITKLSEKYLTVKYVSENKCVEDMKLGTIHACIVFPPDLKIKSDGISEIKFYADYSRLNLVEAVINTVSELIAKRSGEISAELTNKLVDALKQTQSIAGEKKTVIIAMQSENVNLTNKLKGMQTDLALLDVAISLEDFKTSNISEKIEDLKAVAGNALNTSRAAINNIEATANSANVTGDAKTAIIGAIDSARTDLNGIENDLNNITISTDEGSLSWLMTNLETRLNSVKVKLDRVASTRTKINTEISGMEGQIETINNNLKQVEESMQQIDKIISGIEVTNVEKIVSPVKVKVEPVVKQTKLNYLVPTLLVLVIMFASILLATTLVMMEKTGAAHFRNAISPTSSISFFMGLYLTNIIIMAVQAILMLGINAYLFQAYLAPIQLAALLLVLFIAVTLFTLLDMLIGLLFNSEETSTLAAVSAGSIMLFISSTILPLESIPEYIMKIARYNPFVISDFLVKKVYLFNTTVQSVLPDIYILLIYCGVVLVLLILAQVITRAELLPNIYAKLFLLSWRKKQKKELKDSLKQLPKVEKEPEQKAKEKIQKIAKKKENKQKGQEQGKK